MHAVVVVMCLSHVLVLSAGQDGQLPGLEVSDILMSLPEEHRALLAAYMAGRPFNWPVIHARYQSSRPISCMPIHTQHTTLSIQLTHHLHANTIQAHHVINPTEP